MEHLGGKTTEKEMITMKAVTSLREVVVSGQRSLFVKEYIYVLCTFPKCNIFHNGKKRSLKTFNQKRIDMRNRKRSVLFYASNTDQWIPKG